MEKGFLKHPKKAIQKDNNRSSLYSSLDATKYQQIKYINPIILDIEIFQTFLFENWSFNEVYSWKEPDATWKKVLGKQKFNPAKSKYTFT